MTPSQNVLSPVHRMCPRCKTVQILAAAATPEIVYCQSCGMIMEPTPSPRALAKPLIAIIGTEGSGKTVLATTLAKRMGSNDSPTLRIIPQGARTPKYVERVWQTLQSGQWPPSTPPGELFELRWNLEIEGKIDGEMRLIDAAGQDMRLLFGDDEIQSIESLPSHLRPLAEYCNSADIILCLFNLRDFFGQADSYQKTVNDLFVKSALDYSVKCQRPKRMCLVLTQADLYLSKAKECGGWEKLAAKAIPYAFDAHVRDKPVDLVPVAAVAETTKVFEKGQKPRRVPKQGFKSAGLDKLIDWLVAQMGEVGREFQQATETSAVPATEQTALQLIPGQASQPQPAIWTGLLTEVRRLIAGKEQMVSIIAAILLGGGCLFGSSILGRATRPIATFLKKENRDVRGILDHGVRAFGTIRNDGAVGKIRVWARVIENGSQVELKYSDFYLNQGESANYLFELNNLWDLANPHRVDTWAEIH